MPRCCQASSTVTAISAVAAAGAAVVAGHGHDLVPVEGHQGVPAVVVDGREPRSARCGGGSLDRGEEAVVHGVGARAG